MDYVIKDQFNQVYYWEDYEIVKYEHSLKYLWNSLLQFRFTDYETYTRTMKKLLEIKSRTPIYLNSSELYFPLAGIRSTETIYLNYFQISKYYVIENGDLVVVFSTQHSMRVPYLRLFFHQIDNCKKIIRHMNGENYK